jgi:osmoprotectant transport system ATP-binding protein
VEPHELRRGIGYVIQQVGLFVHRSVHDNIATVPRLLDWDRHRIDSRVRELMELVGLDDDLARRYPGELSGGQQQRVGVARALAADPPILLMDEPFGAVDPIVRDRLQDELLGLQERLRKTIVFVTHDIDEAIKLGDRVVVMNVGGIVEQVAAPAELLARPANAFVERFVGSQRGLRRLSLIPLSDVGLEQPGADDARPRVERASSLLDALQAILRAGADAADVLDDGTYAGTITLQRISRETR